MRSIARPGSRFRRRTTSPCCASSVRSVGRTSAACSSTGRVSATLQPPRISTGPKVSMSPGRRRRTGSCSPSSRAPTHPPARADRTTRAASTTPMRTTWGRATWRPCAPRPQQPPLPHHLLSVIEPFERAYEVGLSRLRDEMGCDCVVTGDIAEVQGHPNWIRERSFNGYPPFDTCAYVVPFEDLDFGSAKALARRVLRSGSRRPVVPGSGRRHVRSPRC